MSEECRDLIEVAEGPTVCSPVETKTGHLPTAVQQEAAYGYKVRIDIPYEQALSAVKRSLSNQGLDTVIELDIQDTLTKKLDLQFRPYTVLGVYDPNVLRRAIEIESDSGLLFPCNVVVYEETGGTIIEAIDTIEHFAMSRRRELHDLAREIKIRLQNAIDHVASGVTE